VLCHIDLQAFTGLQVPEVVLILHADAPEEVICVWPSRGGVLLEGLDVGDGGEGLRL
jgi:hypothetical protein